MKTEVETYHIENLKYLYFALRDDREITETHIKNIMEEISSIYNEVTGIDLFLEENDLNE